MTLTMTLTKTPSLAAIVRPDYKWGWDDDAATRFRILGGLSEIYFD